MASSKTYLRVPYAQKDAAKALGAKWDATVKQWYVPANIDVTPFARWQPETRVSEVSSTAINKPRTQTPTSKTSPAAKNEAGGVITYSTIKDFVAYDGDAPPWE